MATRYVSSNPAGSNTSPYDTLAKAATAFATAITGASAGDVFAFSNLHNEAIASPTTYTLPGTAASPNQMYSFDNTQTTISATNLLAGATLSTTGANALSFAGVCSECVGFTFAAGTGAVNSTLSIASAAGSHWRLFNCALQKLGTTGVGSAITLGAGGGGLIELHNTTVQFGAVGDSVAPKCQVRWINTPNAIQGATIPTILLNMNAGNNGSILCEGVDFSALGGKTIISNTVLNLANLKDCKMPSSATTIAATPTGPGLNLVYAIRCDNTGANNEFFTPSYSGTETSEPNITRVGGATTPNGTAFSAKIVTTGNAQWTFPFESLPLPEWNGLTSATRTVTVYGTINSGTLPNNDEIWIEAEYLGSAGSPIGSFVNSTKANNLATGVAVSSDSSSWNSGGSSAGWAPFQLTVALTANLTGPITVRVYAGKANTTYYVDPVAYFS